MVAAPRRRVQRGSFRPLHGSTPLTDADRKVLRLLEGVPPRAWSRAVLAEAAGMPDRSLRRSIEKLRHGGFPVIVAEEGGYTLARTADEVAEFRARELQSRMRVIADEDRVLEAVERLMRDREREGQTVRQGALV